VHELSLAQMVADQIQAVAKRNNAKQVTKAVLSISDLSMIMIDQFVFALEIIKEERFPEIHWEIHRTPGTVECYKCGVKGKIKKIDREKEDFSEFELFSNLVCPKCGSKDVHALTSDSVNIESLEIEQD